MDVYGQIARNLWLASNHVSEADVLRDFESGREFIWIEEEESGYAAVKHRVYLPVDNSTGTDGNMLH